jgi:hypothetical protein
LLKERQRGRKDKRKYVNGYWMTLRKRNAVEILNRKN